MLDNNHQQRLKMHKYNPQFQPLLVSLTSLPFLILGRAALIEDENEVWLLRIPSFQIPRLEKRDQS
jgi:hypothetical protein